MGSRHKRSLPYTLYNKWKRTLHIKWQKHFLSAGDAFLVYPNTEITYQADENDPWEYTWVGFTGSDAAMILRATDFCEEKPFIRNVPNGDDIKTAYTYIRCQGY